MKFKTLKRYVKICFPMSRSNTKSSKSSPRHNVAIMAAAAAMATVIASIMDWVTEGQAGQAEVTTAMVLLKRLLI